MKQWEITYGYSNDEEVSHEICEERNEEEVLEKFYEYHQNLVDFYGNHWDDERVI